MINDLIERILNTIRLTELIGPPFGPVDVMLLQVYKFSLDRLEC